MFIKNIINTMSSQVSFFFYIVVVVVVVNENINCFKTLSI